MKGAVSMNIEFNSLEDLYKRLKPALLTKKEEMNRTLYPYIKEEDIWNYLKEVKWKKTIDLSLAEMVNDILNCDDIQVDNYLKSKLNLKNRMIYFDGGYNEKETNEIFNQ